MEAQIQVFRNGAFGSVRVVEHKGEPWFVASDVAKALLFPFRFQILLH